MNNTTRTNQGTMSKATKGVVAGALGIGLLAGGTTFALWSDDATVEGGAITAGNLDIEAVADSRSWNDVSDGVASPENVIDPASFLIVPGDTIQLSQDVMFELEGDNITADLTASVPGLEGDLADSGLTLTYSLWAGSQELGAAEVGDPIELDGVDVPKDYSGIYTIKANVEFDENTEDRVGATETAELGDIQFTLEQTR